MAEESNPAPTTEAPSVEGAPPATENIRDLSELLKSMTTTTTIEPLDGKAPPKTTATSTHDSSIVTETNPTPRVPHESSVPTSISRSYKIYGIPTHSFCQVFSDRIVLGVTQLQTKDGVSSGHIGSWVYCQASRSPIDPRQVDYELSTLLGGAGGSGGINPRDEKEIYARRVAERLLEKKSVPGGTDRIVLLLGISLLPLAKDSEFSSIERFKALVEVLVEVIEAALGIALGSQ